MEKGKAQHLETDLIHKGGGQGSAVSFGFNAYLSDGYLFFGGSG